MRVTEKGRVTIPKHIRTTAGILPGSELEFSVEAGMIVISKVPASKALTSNDRRAQMLEAATIARATMPPRFQVMSADQILEFLRPRPTSPGIRRH